MNQERPAPDDVPGADGIDSRERNGTGEQADEQQLGITNEEVEDLENDAEGG
ncbi:MAG: hypothetical protein ABI769_06285 [Pseudomonadota bacterium]